MSGNTDRPESTQAHLPFAGVENDLVIMKDGSYRAILKVGSVNFMLKSEQEQTALIYAYQNFLNALNHPIQILMQSRKLDLEPYLKKLESTIVDQKNELIKQQTEDYVAYIRDLINVANIMDKSFYVVVSYAPVVLNNSGLLSGLFNKKPAYLSINQTDFEAHRDELMQRADVIAGELGSMGLKSEILTTEEIVRLLYATYNFDTSAEERVENPENLSQKIISGEKQTPGPEPNKNKTNSSVQGK